MHIPDGYLSPQTYLPLYGVAVSFWVIAARKLKRTLAKKHVPLVAMAAAFSFLVQMFNIPIPGGTTGHAVGGAVIALILGPWVAVMAVSVTLIIQALVFGDGGITALGANCVNMAIVLPFVSYGVFKLVSGKSKQGWRLSIAAFLSGYVGLVITSISTAIQFGIQPLVAHAADGQPLYAPYPLSIAIPAMAIEHMILFGLIEGLVTMLLFRWFFMHDREMIHVL